MKIKKILLLLGLILLLGACAKQIETPPLQQQNLNSNTISEKKVILKNIVLEDFKIELSKQDSILIDLRTKEELEKTGIIAGAKQIDFYDDNFKDTLNSLDKNKKYLIYCQSGGRSGKTLSLMKNLGFTNVLELRGGMNGWLKAKESTVTFKQENTGIEKEEIMDTENTMMNNTPGDMMDNTSEENMTSMMPRTVTLNAKKWEFDKKIIRAKKGEDLTIKVNNLDVLHGIAIPGMKLVGDTEIKVDTSTPGEYPFICATYCGEGHADMTGTLIIE